MHLKAGQATFFSRFQPFLFILNHTCYSSVKYNVSFLVTYRFAQYSHIPFLVSYRFLNMNILPLPSGIIHPKYHVSQHSASHPSCFFTSFFFCSKCSSLIVCLLFTSKHVLRQSNLFFKFNQSSFPRKFYHLNFPIQFQPFLY